MDIDELGRADNWPSIGTAARATMADARWRGWSDTQWCPASIKDSVLRAATRSTLNDVGAQLGWVRFGRHRFSFADDCNGQWALLVPVVDDAAGKQISDIAAFDLANESRRQVFNGSGFAVGLDEAMFDARFHPDNRITVHADLWSWLRSECSGVLPVDWRRTALWMKEWQVGGVVVADDDQGRKVDQQFRRALMPPPLFVRRVIAA